MSESASSKTRVAVALTALALAAFAWWLWSPVLELSLLGWDAYPLIAASRVESFGDFAETFSEELMDGRYPLGRYYRPLVHLSFALDHALWGTNPRGYHATDLGLLIANALALGWLALELASAQGKHRLIALIAASVAAFELVTHPALADVLPAAARRADSLAVLFTSLALIAQARDKRWLAAALVVAALGSKETGAVAAVVVGTLALMQQRRARAVVPLVVAVAAFLSLRTIVLGGIGGGRESSLTLDAPRLSASFARYLDTAIGARVFPGIAAWVALVVILLFVALRWRERTHETERRTGVVAPLLAVWFVALVAITALSGVERGWYELPFVPIRCLAIAWLIGTGLREWRASSLLALALAGWLIAMDTWLAIPAPTLDALRRASAAESEFLARFEREVSASPDGSRITVVGFPMELTPRSTLVHDRQRTLAVLAPYSVDAYAELALPDRTVRLEYGNSRSTPASSNEIVVVLAP